MQEVRVLVSGFHPYDNIDVNPAHEVPQWLSQEGVLLVQGANSNDIAVTLQSIDLPISYKNAWDTLYNELNSFHPHIVLATGLKHASRCVMLERCATNIMDSDRPDIDNVMPQSVKIVADGAAAYWTQLPLRAILQDFAKHEIPASLSSDAGTFVCNSLFYQLLHWSSLQKQKILTGFMSFPQVFTQKKYLYKGLTLQQLQLAAQDVIKESIEYYCKNQHEDSLFTIEH